jgi:hypothetical protein
LPKYDIQFYETTDKPGVPVYAVTLAGCLSRNEVSNRVNYARSRDRTPDVRYRAA